MPFNSDLQPTKTEQTVLNFFQNSRGKRALAAIKTGEPGPEACETLRVFLEELDRCQKVIPNRADFISDRLELLDLGRGLLKNPEEYLFQRRQIA